MNTNLIRNSRNKKLPEAPVYNINLSKMVVTKFFTNRMLVKSRIANSMLSWLVYECGADNSIEYSTYLLKRFIKAFEYMNGGGKLNITDIRRNFSELIADGDLLNTSKPNVFLVNPIYCYNPNAITKKQYMDVIGSYQVLKPEDSAEFSEAYIKLIKTNSLKRKGINDKRN